MHMVYPTQLSTQNMGRLLVNTTSLLRSRPIAGARISVSYTGVPDSMVETATTNSIGQITPIELPAPSIDYSMEPSANQPYSEYDVRVQAPGFEPVEITGVQVLPGVEAIQNVTLIPLENAMGEGNTAESFVIPPNTLFGDYPPKIAENEIKNVEETGEIVLSRVVIPEFVVVHDGPPRDTSAANYYVRYRDYIKNVASSEIYATWPTSTIYANILAIQSFTLNRVYTEWYRNRGYNFTITTSTAYDHKWVPGRNIFDTISQAVDDIFANYLSRPGVIQPIFTQYCDGKQVSCPGWMTS